MRIVSGLIAPLLLLAGTAAAQNIDTITGWNGTTFISSFGVTNTATYGQTITVGGSGATLSGFSFEIGNCSAAVNFRGEVYAWDSVNNRITGASLYESALTSVPSDATFHLVAFNTGAVTLAPGTYVLFATTSKDQTGAPASSCLWGSIGSNTAYAGGNFVFQNNGPTFASLSTIAWSQISQDLAFQATLAATASPSVPAASLFTLAMLAVGLAGLSVIVMRRRNAVLSDK